MEFDLQTFLPYQLNKAAERVSRDFQSVYKREYGMLRTEWRVLFHLGHYGPMTARQICDLGGMHKTKVSRAVAALESKRFLRREMVEVDRRQEILSLTITGQAAFNRISNRARAYQEKLMARFEKREFEILTKALRTLGDADRP